jgi:hypothetical protein
MCGLTGRPVNVRCCSGWYNIHVYAYVDVRLVRGGEFTGIVMYYGLGLLRTCSYWLHAVEIGRRPTSKPGL